MHTADAIGRAAARITFVANQFFIVILLILRSVHGH